MSLALNKLTHMLQVRTYTYGSAEPTDSYAGIGMMIHAYIHIKDTYRHTHALYSGINRHPFHLYTVRVDGHT